MSEFKYLERVLTAGDDNWTAVVRNVGKARRTWGQLAQVIGSEVADPKVSRSFYIAVTQAVLLFEADTWVQTRRMENALDSFQPWVARNITGRQPRRQKDRSWEYSPMAGAIREAGMVAIWTSITRRKNTAAKYIATRPILDLCK